MITCTHPLCLNEVGDLIHSLGLLFHLYRADFISIGLNLKSLHHLGADYNYQYLSVLLTHHWILVLLHRPSFHSPTVLDHGENISLLPKKNIPPNISIYSGESSTTFQHFWFTFHVLSLGRIFPMWFFPFPWFFGQYNCKGWP